MDQAGCFQDNPLGLDPSLIELSAFIEQNKTVPF